jgi:aspartate/methionine/tyrosine aminotransferase
MPSRRLPPTFEPNPWSRRLEEHRASGAALLDLTEANPTRTGLMALGPAERAALADPRGAAYEPDPRGLEAAREAIAAYHASRGAAVDPDRIVLTSGTSEAYAHLFRLAADPGERILVPRPSYPLFEPIAALEGVAVRDYRLEYDGRWRIDLDQLETAIDAATRALVVVQPNHPTGSCPDAGEREQLKALCARHDLMLISDEVFGDHGWDGTPLPTLAAAGPATTFVLGGLSKACGLPQLKLSWIAAAGPERSVAEALAALEWIADLFLSVSTPVQVALPRLLGARDAFQSRARARIAANRARLEDLVARRPEVVVLSADGGWVATLRLPRTRSEEEWCLELLRRDVLVHPGHFYDFEDEAYAVVSLVVEEATFAAALPRIEAVLAET